MDIRPYQPADAEALFALMRREGEDWADYFEKRRDRYITALSRSIAYVAWAGDTAVGYVRCRDDDGFGIYVCDLLVDHTCRGRSYGRLLMERVCADYPEDEIYVMSDVDTYYEKQGYTREGSIFIVKPHE